jgi:putative ABC transport system permease protein
MSTDSSRSALHIDVLLSMDTHVSLAHAMNPVGANLEFTEWGYVSFLTYVVLPEDGSFNARQLDARLASFSKQRVPAASGDRLFRARPMSSFTEIGLNTLVGTDITGISSMLVLKILGGLVLLVACLNYANLATAQAATRGKEVALQKIVGASARQIIVQYLMQASLLVAIAMLLSIASLAFVSLNGQSPLLTGLRIVVGRTMQFWVFMALLWMTVSTLAGAYPAFALSRIRPISALRSARTNKGSRFASALVGLQFGAASFLMIAVLVMSAQNNSLRQSVFSAASDPILIITNDTASTPINRSVLKSELLQIPGVVAVSGIQDMPWTVNMYAPRMLSTSHEATLQTSKRVQRQTIDKDFFAVLDIPVLAGRDFSGASHLGTTTDVVIDRTLSASLGFASPQDAIGKIIYSHRSFDASTAPDQFAVIGVVEDKVLKPLSFGFGAYFYVLDPAAATIPVVRLAKNNVSDAVQSVDTTWRRLVPNEPIKRRFADQQFEQSFFFLNTLSGTFGVLAGFASGIAVMGLVGMALHIIQRRMHEIGVRKTLGASVSQILALLLSSFSKPVIFANLVAWPLAYLVMNLYLSIFARSSGMTLLPFLASFIVTLGIAWLAVVVQATRAARMNPATVLRYE